MVYSILTEARIKPSVAASKPVERSYSVFWTENGNLEDWDSILDLDIVGVWGGFLFGTKREIATGSIGPSSNFPSVDARINERIFFRMKYDKHPRNPNAANLGKIQFTTVSDPIFDDEKSITFDVYPDGKWHLYELNMGEVSTWVGYVNNVRFFPATNGYRNDEFFLNFFEIGTNQFTFSFENSDAGSAAQVMGGQALDQNITITKDSNDKLIVNIDAYGDVQITLTPQTAPPALIARDVALQLGKVGIGGYIRADAYIDSTTQKMIIESGIRAEDSSVVVKDGPNTAGQALGFLDATGYFIGSTTGGTDPADGYTPLSAYRPTTLEILALFDNDSVLPAFTLDPQVFILEGGNRNFGVSKRRIQSAVVVEGRGTNHETVRITTEDSFSGSGKTFIDLNHPFVDDGVLAAVYMNGVADVSGGSKWKVFRPKLDGTLTLVDEGVIGQTPSLDPGQVLTGEPGVFKADVSSQNVKVRRGDLLGIYNVALHTGSFGSEKVDALYYEIDGDASGTFTPPSPSGAGEQGLPLYARGSDTKNKAVVDIDLQKRLNLDTIKITGSEDQRDLEYNLGVASSSVFDATISGSHTICYDVDVFTRTCFNRNNSAYNLQALNDDIIFAENGIAGFGNGGVGGLGGADVDGATYFYANGDAEFLGTQEFVDKDAAAYNFIRDPLGINCFFSSSTPRLDKPIGRAVIYFKDKQNQRSWQIETAKAQGAKGGNGSLPGFQLVPEADLLAVEIDETRISVPKGFITKKTESSAADLLLRNPVILDVIAANGVRNPQQGVDYVENVGELGGVNTKEQATFFNFQWNKFQWEFNTIRTTGFRWYSDFHWSTKISEFQIFAVSSSQESMGDNTQVLFSIDGNTFTTAELLTADDEEADYKLGGSPQYMRLIFRPTLKLALNEAQVFFEEDQIAFGTEGRLVGAATIDDPRVGQTGAATEIPVTNLTGETADLIIDIPADINSTKQLLYFSKLHSADDITTPQVGPPGRVDFTSDKTLKEEENVAINAKCYGLRSLASGTSDVFITDNLLQNPGFETGSLDEWNLYVQASGAESYQIPQIVDISEGSLREDPADGFQTGTYCLGYSIDNTVPLHDSNFTTVQFLLDQTVDVSDYAQEIDTGGAYASVGFRYIYMGSGSRPRMRIIGAPTESGANASAGTIIDEDYGSNLLRTCDRIEVGTITDDLASSVNLTVSNIKGLLKPNTRFLRIELYIRQTGSIGSGLTGIYKQKFWCDDFELKLELPALSAAKWYKSWRTGLIPTTSGATLDGFTDANFAPVTEFVTITGSTHWWQPFDANNTSGVPNGGSKTQTQDFSYAFEADRFKGVQSFRQMTITDPGFLGAQWGEEKNIAGLRIMMHHETSAQASAADAYPRYFQIEVLRTRDELGGAAPDLDNPNHFKVAGIWRQIQPLTTPDSELTGSFIHSDGPFSKISTWLFADAPIRTEGMRIVFTRNCDQMERATHPNSTIFSQITSCPADNIDPGSDFVSYYGIGAGYFIPLESVSNTNLPLDNVREHQIPGQTSANTGNVYAAVDLGQHYHIDTSEGLFELIATTVSQSEWNTSNVLYSSSDTDDPNEVVWEGSSNYARWLRFTTTSVLEYEDTNDFHSNPGAINNFLYVDSIPQSTINQARIYPNLTTALIPTEGYNASWDDLGTTLSDNKNSTFIYYSDYPIVAMDLGKPYLLSNDASVVRNRHDLIKGVSESPTDRQYWDPDDADNFTYATAAFRNTDRPERVTFQDFSQDVPDLAVRWVAFKGAYPLLIPVGGDPPKTYNFQTQGQILFNAIWKPRNTEVFTENSQWFSNKKAALQDISTFKFGLGQQFTALDGTDYGSAAGSSGDSVTDEADNLGSPFLVFDGKFDELASDFDGWGVQVRDPETGLEDSTNDFPHSIWRVFRDIETDTVLSRDVRAILIQGYNEAFYPTDFQVQKLKENTDGSIKDPNDNDSWETITDASFTGIDTFQSGLGFTHIFPAAVSTKGIRVRITDSVYPDDSVVTQTDTDTGNVNSYFADVSGPQTRVSRIVIYEESVEETTIQGTILTNHMLSATVSSTTEVAGHAIGQLKDDRLSTYWQSTGFSDTIDIQLAGPRPITYLVWEQDPKLGGQSALASTNAPQNFALKGIVDGQEETLVVGSGVLGTTFSGILAGAPVTAQNFTFEITGVQGEQEDANSIVISELKLLEIVEQSAPLTVVESTTDRRPGGTNTLATKVTYAAGADAVARVTADGLDGGYDTYFSGRDFFSLWVYVNNVSLLDTQFGNFKLGNSPDVFYQWDFSSLSLQSGWQQLRLQFRTADDTSPIEFEPGFQYNSNTGDTEVDFRTPDVTITSSIDGNASQRVQQAPGIRFFELEFRGTRASEELVIILDDFRFVRNRYDDTCKFAPALYLNNSELLTIFLEGLDLATGAVEFWFQPDWDTGGRLEADRPIIPALFRIMRPDGKFLSMFYRPNTGFVIMIFDGNQLYQFVTNVNLYLFEKFDTFHVAAVWDAQRRVAKAGASLALYINGEPIYGTDQQWDAVREGGTAVIFGAEVGQKLATTPDNATALTFTPIPTQSAKNTTSTWGVIENLKIYNYPKTDFSDIYSSDITRTQILTPSEMIEVSLDGVNFYGVGSNSLPLSLDNVASGATVPIYVRTILPSDLKGDEKRDASLLVRWKTPLRECE